MEQARCRRGVGQVPGKGANSLDCSVSLSSGEEEEGEEEESTAGPVGQPSEEEEEEELNRTLAEMKAQEVAELKR